MKEVSEFPRYKSRAEQTKRHSLGWVVLTPWISLTVCGNSGKFNKWVLSLLVFHFIIEFFLLEEMHLNVFYTGD